jgi:hypothetical protein
LAIPGATGLKYTAVFTTGLNTDQSSWGSRRGRWYRFVLILARPLKTNDLTLSILADASEGCHKRKLITLNLVKAHHSKDDRGRFFIRTGGVLAPGARIR